MYSQNIVILGGNLGQDAETRFTNNGTAVTTFSLATQNSYKGKDGNTVKNTDWHKVVGFGLPDFIRQGLTKGEKVAVTGRLTYNSYTDKDGVKRKTCEIIADSIQLVNNKASVENTEEYTVAAEGGADLPF